MATHVYHWRHGWIPLTHEAALSKTKGNEKAAHEIMQGVRQDHLRRTSNVTAVAKGTRVALRDKNTGHSLTISSSHAASFHDQGHTITGVHDGSFTTKNDYGNTAHYGADGRQIVPRQSNAPHLSSVSNSTRSVQASEIKAGDVVHVAGLKGTRRIRIDKVYSPKGSGDVNVEATYIDTGKSAALTIQGNRAHTVERKS